MTICLGKSCSFGLPGVPFVNCCQFIYLVISPFGFEGRMWDLIVSAVPDNLFNLQSHYEQGGKNASVVKLVYEKCLSSDFLFSYNNCWRRSTDSYRRWKLIALFMSSLTSCTIIICSNRRTRYCGASSASNRRRAKKKHVQNGLHYLHSYARKKCR